MSGLSVKRVYDEPAKGDGARILVDRLWPRGLTKEKAQLDAWLKDLSPSDDLRKRFHGHPDDWAAFREAYAAELKAPEAKAAVEELEGWMRKGPVTLLYAAKDEAKNNAVALKLWLEAR